jgi:hypothetical protein
MLRSALAFVFASTLVSTALAQEPLCRSVTTVAPGDSDTHGFRVEVRSLRGARVLSREEPFSEARCFSSEPPSRDADDLVFFVHGSPSRLPRMALR